MKIVAMPKKKRSIRAINQGTRYDLTGNLRSLTRAIERGEHGEIKDVLVVFTTRKSPTEGRRVGFFHFGTGEESDCHWMLETAKNRIEPA